MAFPSMMVGPKSASDVLPPRQSHDLFYTVKLIDLWIYSFLSALSPQPMFLLGDCLQSSELQSIYFYIVIYSILKGNPNLDGAAHFHSASGDTPQLEAVGLAAAEASNGNSVFRTRDKEVQSLHKSLKRRRRAHESSTPPDLLRNSCEGSF
ncbi:hypothetical protein AXF42_Ash003513 [Apostasia shenzhenica]|uniref:Uncharacterized protein n=1 Tax=Apostasia shenzhenica TaxID=1088818 RepID=A0A2I0BGF0_9ASPA|nr:hypothetical protein AXF42_Ash003513 [Apostasia shenzhenica]